MKPNQKLACENNLGTHDPIQKTGNILGLTLTLLRTHPHQVIGWPLIWVITGNKKREFRFHPIKEAIIEEPADITPYVDQLDDTMKEKVLQLQKGRSVEWMWNDNTLTSGHYLSNKQTHSIKLN